MLWCEFLKIRNNHIQNQIPKLFICSEKKFEIEKYTVIIRNVRDNGGDI